MKPPSKTTLHGVFLDVFGLGVLLTGPCGIGKSELGLSLISRGHALIADDAVEFGRTTNDALVGSCHPVLKDFLEVRGLGPLNIRSMYGDKAIKDQQNLDLIVYVNKLSDNELINIDRLHGLYRTCNILEMTVPEVTVPVAAGRDLVALVEAAVLNQKLKLEGYDASETFISRQEQFMTVEANSTEPQNS